MKSLLSVLIIAAIVAFSEAKPTTFPQPQALESFKLNETLNQGSCSYRVTIKTSCSSPRYTRDQISLSFGDANGNQVYAPRIDDPSSRAFERCSTDTYDIHGPCTYQVCYLYVYRSGYDGWKPERVTVSGYYSKAITFYYNTFIPNGIWYGFNLCHNSVVSKATE
ncbi:hypothetical protein K1719_018636 [Acacia pycnantha]|nr:hypothetical protein K1719_018636 [Acacia pycnantha]